MTLVRFSDEGEGAEAEREDIVVRVRGVEEWDMLVGRKAKTPENPKFI